MWLHILRESESNVVVCVRVRIYRGRSLASSSWTIEAARARRIGHCKTS